MLILDHMRLTLDCTISPLRLEIAHSITTSALHNMIILAHMMLNLDCTTALLTLEIVNDITLSALHHAHSSPHDA